MDGRRRFLGVAGGRRRRRMDGIGRRASCGVRLAGVLGGTGVVRAERGGEEAIDMLALLVGPSHDF